MKRWWLAILPLSTIYHLWSKIIEHKHTTTYSGTDAGTDLGYANNCGGLNRFIENHTLTQEMNTNISKTIRIHTIVLQEVNEGPSWSWSYDSWITNYLCNQCISPLTLWVRIPFMRVIPDTTLCDQVWQWLATGRWFSPSITIMI